MTPRKPTRAKQLGVTDAEYARLLAAQDGKCAIGGCTVRAVTRRYHVDHNHESEFVRGLLCHVHNRRLWKGATARELYALADYLYRAEEAERAMDEAVHDCIGDYGGAS